MSFLYRHNILDEILALFICSKYAPLVIFSKLNHDSITEGCSKSDKQNRIKRHGLHDEKFAQRGGCVEENSSRKHCPVVRGKRGLLRLRKPLGASSNLLFKLFDVKKEVWHINIKG